MNRILVVAGFAAYFCCPAFSSMIIYSATGAFPASGVPATALSANGASFEFDFTLPDTPVPVFSASNNFVVTTPVTYKLGGTAFPSQMINVFFFTSGVPNGGFLISNFPPSGGDAVTYFFTGTQLFTGTTTAPTLTPGTFSIDNASIQINLSGGPGIGFAVPSTVTATTVPEPASFSLMALAISAVALRRLKRGPSLVLE